MTINANELADMLQLLAQAVRLVPSLQANPAAQAVMAAMPQVVSAPVPGPDLRTLNEWIVVYEGLLRERGYKANTIKNRMATLAHVKRLWGAIAVRALRPHQVASALKQFLPKRSSTACRVLSELRDVYTEAIANDWADTNPAKDIKMPVHKVMRARLPFTVWQSMLTLAQTGPQRWLPSLLLLGIATGQRRADLAKMRFDDVVTDESGEQFLRVEQQKEAGKGYGARVEIPLALRLDCIGMTVGEVIEHCRKSAKPGPTLLRKAGGGAIEESSLSARFHECIVSVLGEGAYETFKWPSLHEMRSLASRMYRDQGLTMKQVQTLLGHKNEEMTEEYVDDRGLSAKDWKRVDLVRQAVAEAVEAGY